MGPPGWVVGPAVAIGTLMFVMATPLGAIGAIGFVLIPVIAIGAGAATASLVDSRRALNTAVVIATTVLVYAIFIGRLQSQPGGGQNFAPAGTSTGGASMGGPTVPPPP